MNLEDPNSAQRKTDHIELAFKAQLREVDERFYYEPMLKAHPSDDVLTDVQFLGKSMRAPIWISSMTGGTEKAGLINKRLAKACGNYGLGMGLGSCRMLLESDEYLSDFRLRAFVGDEQPLFANLGIAQIEELLASGEVKKILNLIDKTETDGLIIHVNPLQEWLQPEGDHIRFSPLETIGRVKSELGIKIIVKEVGQGFGPASMKALLNSSVDAIDFAAAGGTNFAQLELLRRSNVAENYQSIAHLGHSADEMVDFYNAVDCDSDIAVIISGGLKSFLDGYYFTSKIKANAIYGHASTFLAKALEGEEALDDFVKAEIEGLKLANTYLSIRK